MFAFSLFLTFTRAIKNPRSVSDGGFGLGEAIIEAFSL